jgi:hypothetical protein
MPGFDEIQKTLAAAKLKHAEAERTLRQATAKLGQAEAAAKLKQREGGAARPPAGLRDSVTKGKTGLKDAAAALQNALDAFAELSDPRTAIKNLAASDPFLLLPLRLETRFRTIGSGAQQQRELWVRAYPDSCLIDTFEPDLTEAELISAKAYWSAVWQANGDAGRKRAAFDALFSGHGAGRTRWILKTFTPLNQKEEPSRADGSLALVIAVNPPLDKDLRKAAAAYWLTLWQKQGAIGAQEQALKKLARDVGDSKAEEIAANTRPVNFDERPADDATPAEPAFISFLDFPPDPPVRPASWSSAPRAEPMPDRLVLILRTGNVVREILGNPIRSPLHAGFDPTGQDGGLPVAKDGGLEFAEETRWMSDFEEAVKAGMGFKATLSTVEASRGFDELRVIGICAGLNGSEGKAKLEAMLSSRLNSSSGFALVPQGTPTNNTEDADAGYSRADDPDLHHDLLTGAPQFSTQKRVLRKQDGQHLAEVLGIDPGLLSHVANAGGRDVGHARAMNTALWPATIGYFMTSMMQPVFSDADIAATREFFVSHVSGCGPVPAVRIGRQPYGILATTAFQDIAWLEPAGSIGRRRNFLADFYPLVMKMDGLWNAMAAKVAHVGSAADPDETLLDILGLHPASAEFHYRFGESSAQVSNFIKISGLDFTKFIITGDFQKITRQLLVDFGYDGAVRTQIEKLFFHEAQGILDGGIAYTNPPAPGFETEHQRYISWLIEAARKSVETLEQQRNMPDGKIPRALVYILLRHALLLSYSEAARQLHKRDTVRLDASALRAMALEEPLPHLRQAKPSDKTPESKWELLFKADERITGDPSLSLADYLAKEVGRQIETRDLEEMLAALEQLAAASHEEVDRAFREHIDCASYRLDAWQTGFVSRQLEIMSPKRTGILLGAYGWLEDVRPARSALNPQPLPPQEMKLIDPLGKQPPLMRDPASGGLIHAPSVTQGVTASVLRSAYMSAATDADRETFSINLSSERVRNALFLMDGMRSGQKLNALLGYRFERGLHDRHRQAETDQYLPMLREAFPIASGRLKATRGKGEGGGATAARNVVDGLRLIESMRKSGQHNYPFGANLDPSIPAAAKKAISNEAQRLEDLHDSLGDLTLAEAVHQAVQGNYDRVAAALDATAKGAVPPEPDVVTTPTTGIAVTHRMAIHLDPLTVAPAGATPRQLAEPALDSWLAAQLPPLDRMGCKVAWKDAVNGQDHDADVTVASLGLAAIDLVHAWQAENLASFAELDDRIIARAKALNASTLRTDDQIEVRYMEAPAGGVSLFDCAALIQPLAALVRKSRPLKATDMQLDSEASRSGDQSVTVDASRIKAALQALETLTGDLAAAQANAGSAAASGEASSLAFLDEAVEDAGALMLRAAAFGMAQTRPQGLDDSARRLYAAIIADAGKQAKTFNEAVIRCNDRLLIHAGLPPSASLEERMEKLRDAETALPFAAVSQASAEAALRADIVAARDALSDAAGEFSALLSRRDRSIGGLLVAAEAAATTPAGAPALRSTEHRKQAVLLAGDIATALSVIRTEADKRVKAAAAKQGAAAAEADAAKRAALLQDAAAALFGESFRIYPVFTPDAASAAEIANARAAAQSGETLRHLVDDLKMPLPVDEWLYGVARVREPVGELERIMVLSEGFGLPGIALEPLQLPFRPRDFWLGLDFPQDYDIDSSRLLYTARFAPDGLSGARCGILVDEWTEVIPGLRNEASTDVSNLHKRTTGVAFHFDRPNAEAPQSWLLVTPAKMGAVWSWEELTRALDWTWAMARKRAVEPEHLEGALAQFLPATLSAVSAKNITINAVLAANISVAAFMKG